MTAPTIINPGPTPSRAMPEDEFESTANAFFGRLPAFSSSIQTSLNWMDATFTATDQAREQAQSAAQAASNDAKQTTADRQQTGQDRTTATQAAQSASDDAEKTAADRVQTGEDRAATAQDRQLAQEARDSAQAIAAGDVVITDLQPGSLMQEGDFVTVGPEGSLVKRSLRDGSQMLSLSRYDVASVTATATLDCSLSQVFEVDASSSAVTLDIVNLPPQGRAETIVIDVSGIAGVTFNPPSGVSMSWSGGQQPPLGDNWTQFVLIYTGNSLRGGVGYSA